MKLNIKSTIFATAAILSFTLNSCKKESPEPEPTVPAAETGTVKVNLEHKWGTGSTNFTLNMDLVHPATGDAMNFTTMKYYISNFRLKKSDGTWWNHPESYFLVDLSNPSSAVFNLTGVPVGQYTGMEYMFGVDSTRNVSGAQTGALAIANNMFWSWNSGYIMLKAEGTSTNSGTGSYAFHLGGFTGANKVISTSSVEFPNELLNIAKNHTSEVHYLVHPDQLWTTVGSVSGTNTIHMPGAGAKTMAADFVNGIVFDHLHN